MRPTVRPTGPRSPAATTSTTGSRLGTGSTSPPAPTIIPVGDYLTAEARARVAIDLQLADCGWQVQDRTGMNLYAAQGVAVREFIMAPGHGRADYLLFVDGQAVGAVEAKPSGTPAGRGGGPVRQVRHRAAPGVAVGGGAVAVPVRGDR